MKLEAEQAREEAQMSEEEEEEDDDDHMGVKEGPGGAGEGAAGGGAEGGGGRGSAEREGTEQEAYNQRRHGFLVDMRARFLCGEDAEYVDYTEVGGGGGCGERGGGRGRWHWGEEHVWEPLRHVSMFGSTSTPTPLPHPKVGAPPLYPILHPTTLPHPSNLSLDPTPQPHPCISPYPSPSIQIDADTSLDDEEHVRRQQDQDAEDAYFDDVMDDME